jgi:hypothetical protein
MLRSTPEKYCFLLVEILSFVCIHVVQATSCSGDEQIWINNFLMCKDVSWCLPAIDLFHVVV